MKRCFVPQCKNTTDNSPNKVFVRITQSLKEKWFKIVDKPMVKYAYCCEDHLNLREDLENYYKWKIINARPILKETANLYLLDNEVEVDNNINYIPPDICRCCLKTNGESNITEALNGDNANETYNSIIKDCFSIQISHLSEWGASQKICNGCVGHLNSAYKFKKQILEAEKSFTDHIKKLYGYEYTSPKEHNAQEEVDNSNIEDEGPEESVEELEVDFQDSETEIEVKPNIEELNIKVEPMESDSETPIAELIKKIQEKNIVNNVENHNVLVPQKKPQVKEKSHRKRVEETCRNIFKYTTACPFRHRKSWFQCFFCLEVYMEISSLRQHIEKEHKNTEKELKGRKHYPNSIQLEISVLKCKLCKLNLNGVIEMKDHLEKVHKKVIYQECIADYKINKSPYTCHICNKEFHVFRSLTTHINDHYPNFICDICGKSFINMKRCQVHKLTHEQGNYPCGQCDKILKSKMSMSNHVEAAHTKRIMKCHICFKVMKHYNDRIKHMSVEHGITHKFPCHICGREYILKHYLATHLRQTHGHKDKKCSVCGMAFITNHGLKKHMLKHSGEKPYTCAVCSKSYSRRYTLREHMKVHAETVSGDN